MDKNNLRIGTRSRLHEREQIKSRSSSTAFYDYDLESEKVFRKDSNSFKNVYVRQRRWEFLE